MTEGEKRGSSWITCRCGARWTARGLAHCGGCHNSYSGISTFDQHRSMTGEHGVCKRPAEVVNSLGERLLWLRDGVWRGPELTEDEKTARFGNRK
jgi:hypothetical protein